MFYLDYILYIIILILSWVLIYKILNTREGFEHRKEIKDKNQGFQHKGNAFISRNSIEPSTSDDTDFGLFDIMQGVYSFLNIFAMVFVEFPTKYIVRLRNLAQKQLKLIYNAYKSIVKKSNEVSQTYFKKFNVLGYMKLGFTRH